MEVCITDTQQQHRDHECDVPFYDSPKPRKEPLLLLHPNLKRSLPFLFSLITCSISIFLVIYILFHSIVSLV